MTAQLSTAFNDKAVTTIENAVQALRDARESLERVYWEAHKNLSAISFKNSEEQNREMVALGELAKGIQGLRSATSTAYCMTITVRKADKD